MTDELSKARTFLSLAENALSESVPSDEERARFLVQIAIANALFSLASDVGKIALLLRQRMKK